jgi:hypothetical protein
MVKMTKLITIKSKNSKNKTFEVFPNISNKGTHLKSKRNPRSMKKSDLCFSYLISFIFRIKQ